MLVREGASLVWGSSHLGLDPRFVSTPAPQIRQQHLVVLVELVRLVGANLALVTVRSGGQAPVPTLHGRCAEEAMLRTAAGQAGVDGGWEAAALTSSTYLWT